MEGVAVAASESCGQAWVWDNNIRRLQKGSEATTVVNNQIGYGESDVRGEYSVDLETVALALAIQLMRYPTPEESTRINAALDSVLAAKGLTPAQFGVLGRIRDAFLEPSWADPEERMAEYTRLFISDAPRACCLPLESFYTSDLIRGEPFYQVSREYEDAGFEVHDVPADHILAELAFVARLRSRSLDGSSNPEEAAAMFIHKHMSWIRRWKDDVQKHAHWAFYSEVASFIVSVVAGDWS